MPIMPQQDEPYYCSQQIHVPPDLPDILKQFTKAAIRTQPKDVLAWSAAYFHAIANGEVPPAKERLEKFVATQKNDTGLTPELLRVLNRQLGPKKTMPVLLIEEKWEALSLPKEVFDDIVRIGDFTGDVRWLKFLALSASTLTSDITSSMKLLCEILTADPDGGAARIPFPLFKDLYLYLAYNDGEISMEDANKALYYLDEQAKLQKGYVQPRNFLSPHCPSLAGSAQRQSGVAPRTSSNAGVAPSSQAMVGPDSSFQGAPKSFVAPPGREVRASNGANGVRASGGSGGEVRPSGGNDEQRVTGASQAPQGSVVAGGGRRSSEAQRASEGAQRASEGPKPSRDEGASVASDPSTISSVVEK